MTETLPTTPPDADSFEELMHINMDAAFIEAVSDEPVGNGTPGLGVAEIPFGVGLMRAVEMTPNMKRTTTTVRQGGSIVIVTDD